MPRTGKFNAKKTVVNGIVFDSETESIRYTQLLEKVAKGEIVDLELQPVFELQAHFRHTTQKDMIRAITYKGDFRYKEMPLRNVVVEDTKGMRTEGFNLKMKLLLFKYPEIDFRLIKVKRPSKRKEKATP